MSEYEVHDVELTSMCMGVEFHEIISHPDFIHYRGDNHGRGWR